MNTEGLAVACADIGSIMKSNFGWGFVCGDQQRSGETVDELVHEVVASLAAEVKVALGFECPLWVPVPEDPLKLTAGRVVDGNKPWSAGAGASALVTGLTETAWILREIRRRLKGRGLSLPQAYLDWQNFTAAHSGIFLWEAFVTGGAKAVHIDSGMGEHVADALIACKEFTARLPNPAAKSCSEPKQPVRSLIGAAMLWSGWSEDLTLLGAKSLVVKPSESPT